MSIQGFNESVLSDSEIFQTLSSSNEGNPIASAIKLIQTSKHLTNEDIEASYLTLRASQDRLDNAALKAFDSGDIVLVYNDVPSLSVTQAFPFLVFKSQSKNKFISYVFMDKYVRRSREGALSVPTPILRDLLIGALIANKLKTNYNKLVGSQFMQNLMMNIYRRCVSRILMRLFSIGIEKVTVDASEYYMNKFFLLRIFGSTEPPENIEVAATKHFRYVDEIKLAELRKAYDTANPEKISDLLALIKPLSDKMRILDLGTFSDGWMKYFYIPLLLAIDNIEYLIFMTITLFHSTPGISNVAASELIREVKSILKIKEELLKIIE